MGHDGGLWDFPDISLVGFHAWNKAWKNYVSVLRLGFTVHPGLDCTRYGINLPGWLQLLQFFEHRQHSSITYCQFSATKDNGSRTTNRVTHVHMLCYPRDFRMHSQNVTNLEGRFELNSNLVCQRWVEIFFLCIQVEPLYYNLMLCIEN
jgi:hypothetical protein